MPDIPGTTRAQTIFLRAFRTSPTGPAPADWPSPAILRKWLRKPAFRAALASVRQALQFQSDFQLANAATAAARKLVADDTHLTTRDLGDLLRLSHLRQRFALPAADDDAPQPHLQHQHDEAGDEDPEAADDDPAFAAVTAAARAGAKLKPDHGLSAPGCQACMIRQRNPDWIEDKALFKRLAFEQGYASPLREWPDFPDPAPQDTFYYKLVQDTAALLRYMDLYDRAGNDHRFSPILLNCRHLVPRDDNDLPRFQSQRPQPPSNGDGPWRMENQPPTAPH